jgi:Arc/MetJ-type ribon-helix-helix transcriptional regulator
MANKLVNMRFDGKLLREVDAVAKEGLFGSRTEFIKDAVRKAIDDFRTKQLLIAAEKRRGEGKRRGIKEPTPEEFEKIREEVGNRILKEHGLL